MTTTNFKPVITLEELDTLIEADLIDGFMSAERGDPEPGENRGKSFWHGWRSRMMDLGEIQSSPEHRALTEAYVERMRKK